MEQAPAAPAPAAATEATAPEPQPVAAVARLSPEDTKPSWDAFQFDHDVELSPDLPVDRSSPPVPERGDVAAGHRPLPTPPRRAQSGATTPRLGDEASMLLFGGSLAAVRGQVQAVAVSLCLLALLHLNAVLWGDYIGLMLWAFVLSEALRTGRERYLNALRQLHAQLKEHDDGGLVYWLLQVAGAKSMAEVRRRPSI